MFSRFFCGQGTTTFRGPGSSVVDVPAILQVEFQQSQPDVRLDGAPDPVHRQGHDDLEAVLMGFSAHLRHFSESYDKLEAPQFQLFVGVMDIPVALQRQVPTVFQCSRCSSWRSSTCPLSCNDRCTQLQRVDTGRGAEADPHGSVCLETIEISQLQFTDKVVVPVVQIVQFSQVPVVEKTDGSHSCSRRENHCGRQFMD